MAFAAVVPFSPSAACSEESLTHMALHHMIGSFSQATSEDRQYWGRNCARPPRSIFIYFFTPFSPQFRGIQLVVTVLSHRCNSHTNSGEAKVESHASSETQPNKAALLLDTMPT
jgi:hypothetical protein